MPAAFAPPAAATAAGAAAAASAVDAARPHPLPTTPLPPPLPSLVWAAGRGGDLAGSRALLIFSTPTRRAAQRACAARAAQSSHARARANVGSSPGQRQEAHTSWPAHTKAEEEGRRCRTERRMPTFRDTCAASAAGSTPLRGSGAAHTYGTPFYATGPPLRGRAGSWPTRLPASALPKRLLIASLFLAAAWALASTRLSTRLARSVWRQSVGDATPAVPPPMKWWSRSCRTAPRSRVRSARAMSSFNHPWRPGPWSGRRAG